jgi:uncharacterized protein YjhX (UPF0386 family)
MYKEAPGCRPFNVRRPTVQLQAGAHVERGLVVHLQHHEHRGPAAECVERDGRRHLHVADLDLAAVYCRKLKLKELLESTLSYFGCKS